MPSHKKLRLVETFEKCSILPAQLNPYLIFNRGSKPKKAKILKERRCFICLDLMEQDLRERVL
jgi:hypothetical protein